MNLNTRWPLTLKRSFLPKKKKKERNEKKKGKEQMEEKLPKAKTVYYCHFVSHRGERLIPLP